jgi:hypothetical protein
LKTCCRLIKGVAAISSNGGSAISRVRGSRRLIMVAGELIVVGRMIIGIADNEHDLGQRVRANCEVVQLTSGLWAFSQSVPRMMSWVPIAVT